MSDLGTIVVAFSIGAFAAISIYWFFLYRRLVAFTMQISIAILATLFLHRYFDFPTIQINKAPWNWNWEDSLPIIGLYIAMVLGMLAQYLYAHFNEAAPNRTRFDIGVFLAPIFISPIIFVPLFEAFKSSHVQDQGLIMVFFIAFENGFFFKSYLDRRTHENKPTPAL
jgi:hypothetical protein